MEFDKFARNYQGILDRTVSPSGEDSEYFADYKARYLARLLSTSFAGRVLDFGCGVGLLSRALKRRLPAIQLDGFDVSAESISALDPPLTCQGVFTSDVTKLRREYGLIVVANVLHHVPPGQRKQVVFDLANRLAPRGLLAVFEHNCANPVTRWVVRHCPFDKDAILLPPVETRSYLTQGNLSVVRRDYIVFMPHALARLRPMEPMLAWLPLGAQYVTVAEKNA